jgi:hypothetical protein
VSSALPWLLFILVILEFQGLIQHTEHLKALTPTDLKGEIVTIQWFLLWLWRGAGARGQCSLSAPQGWLRARLPFFAEIFFLCAAVSPRTSTNTHLEAIPTQQVTIGVFQCDDGEDGPPIHAPHARAVAHEVVVDGGTVRANLRWFIRHHYAVSKSVGVIQILRPQISFHSDEMLGRCQPITIGAALMVGAAPHDFCHVL